MIECLNNSPTDSIQHQGPTTLHREQDISVVGMDIKIVNEVGRFTQSPTLLRYGVPQQHFSRLQQNNQNIGAGNSSGRSNRVSRNLECSDLSR